MTDEVIYGLDTSADDAARLMFQFINNDWIKVETALYTGKWFDYRFLNPVQATYLYAHHFVRCYRAAFSRNIDSIKGPNIRIVLDEDMFHIREGATKKDVARRKQQISGLWRGRQVADAMGMPYDVYLDRAFHWTLRYWQQRHLPRAQQLYGDIATDRAAIDWDEYQNHKLYFSRLPQYQNTAYEAITAQMNDGDFEGKILQSQNAHHEWLFEQAERRGNHPEVLSRMIFDDKVLPEIKVRGRLNAELFQRVLAVTDRNPDQSRYN
jgi:hypothetical protein